MIMLGVENDQTLQFNYSKEISLGKTYYVKFKFNFQIFQHLVYKQGINNR